MRKIGILVFGLLALVCWAAPARAYPLYAGSVTDSTGTLSPGQITGLTQLLNDQTTSHAIAGHIFISQPLDTWNLDAYAARLLDEWRAQGAVDETAYLLVVVPSQHRLGLAFGPALPVPKDPWPREQLQNRIAVHCESGALYAAGSTLIAGMSEQVAPAPRINGPSSRQMIMMGGLVLMGGALWRASRNRQSAPTTQVYISPLPGSPHSK